MKPKSITPLVAFTVLGLTHAALAQTTLFWRQEATSGSWQTAGNWWDGTQSVAPGGSEILRFANDAQVTMSNDLVSTTRHRIYFDSGSTASRTISGSTQNEFLSVSAIAPMIRNDSVVGHALNFPILINDQNLILHAATAPLSLGGAISGSAGLQKDGADTVTLSGPNTYGGKTTINGGTLSIDDDGRLGTAPASFVADQLTLNGGSLGVTGASSASMANNRGITLGTSGGTLNNSSMSAGLNANFNAVISGTGPLALRANGNTSDTGGGVGGNLTLGNTANTFTGDVTIHSGVVNFASDGSFGNTANDIIIAGGGLVATDNRTLPTTRDIVLSGGGDRIFRCYGSRTFTINGAIAGTGSVRHTDGGTLQLNGANSFTGNLISAAGSGRIIALGGANTYTGYTHITNTSTVRLDANNVMPDTTAVLLYASATLNANGKSDTVRGVFVGGSSDTSATVNLGPIGSTGTLTITNNSMPAGSPTNIGGSFYGKLSGVGSVEYKNTAAHTATWDWQNTANDFTGNIIITSGRLRTALNTGNIGAFGNSANDIVFNGDVVSTLGNGEGKASLQGSASGALILGVDRSIILNSGKEGTMYVWGGNTYTTDGQITGGGNLRKEDGGTLLLNNTSNNYTGLTRIALGTLKVGFTGVIPDASGVEIAGGNLDLNNVGETVASLNGTGGAVNGGSSLTVLTSGSASYAGSIESATTLHMAGSGTQTISGGGDNVNGWAAVSSGTLVLGKVSSGSVHAVGRTDAVGLTITGGTAKLGGSGNDQIYFRTDVSQNAGVFDFNGANEGFRGLTGNGGTVSNSAVSTTSTMTVGESTIAGNSFTYAGAIENGAGTMVVTKTGLGTQILTGASTYTGATTVNQGRLVINGSLTGSDVTVSAFAGAGIGGTGSISGLVTVNYPGVIAPGSSIGTLSVGNCSLGGVLEIEIDGTSADRLNVSGNLDISTADLDFNPTGAGADQPAYIIASYGSLTGTEFLNVIDLPSGYSIDYNYQGNKQIAIVKPSTTPYQSWASDKGLDGTNNAPGQDPDGDGVSNLGEFAFDDNPLTGAPSGKVSGRIRTLTGGDALTLTLPVRSGAVISETSGEMVSNPIDGVTYHIQGSGSLSAWNLKITEVTGADAVAAQAGMPVLSTGWEYRTFRVPGTPSVTAREFIRAVAE